MEVDSADGRGPARGPHPAGASSRHLWIEGRVQGVGYRVWFEDTAISLGLGGWVRNRHDGRVEAIICGDETGLAAMIRASRRGPPGASVSDIRVEPAAGLFDVFRRLPTA